MSQESHDSGPLGDKENPYSPPKVEQCLSHERLQALENASSRTRSAITIYLNTCALTIQIAAIFWSLLAPVKEPARYRILTAALLGGCLSSYYLFMKRTSIACQEGTVEGARIEHDSNKIQSSL